MPVSVELESIGRLRFLRASSFVVMVGPSEDRRKMCRINFGSDGSIFFSFSYFPQTQGILAEGRYRKGDPSAKIPLTERGKVTSHLVKLTHHTSGEVLFSQSGKVRSEIRTKSFPLLDGCGFVLQQNLYNTRSLAPFQPKAGRKNDAGLHFRDQAGLKANLSLTVEWHTLEFMEALVHPTQNAIGPDIKVFKQAMHMEPYPAFLVAQPSSSPLARHCLVVSCGPIDPIAALTDPHMVILGGWGPCEVDDQGRDHSMLAAMYPVKLFEKTRAELGTVDLIPTSRSA